MSFWHQYTRDERMAVAWEATNLGPAGPRIVARKTGIPKSTIYMWQCEFGLRVRGTGRMHADPITDPGFTEPPTDAPDDDIPPEECEEVLSGPNSWVINLKSPSVQTFEQLVERCKVDLSEWEKVEFKVKTYQMSYVPRAVGSSDTGWRRSSAKAVTVQMYGLTARFVRKVAVIDARSEIAQLVEDAKTQIVRAPLVVVKPPASGYMLELAITDLHGGQLSWGRETGGPDYDLSLAVDTFYAAVETLLARSAQHTFERVVFVAGNDLLNADGPEGTTTRGTRQDNDSRHFKVFQAMRRCNTTAIERIAKEVAPVDVIVMPGNHDRLSSLLLGDALECWFHSNPHVNVDAEPRTRKYLRHGQVLLGFNHGDIGKPTQWSRLMPVEVPDLWSATRYREVHVGHFHHTTAHLDEVNGVRVRLLPSLAPPSAWSASEGFVGALPSSEAFHWHGDYGLVGTAHYNHRAELLAAAS